MISQPTPLLKEQAYSKIKDDILREVFKPGQFLSESQLIVHLGMSKTPIKSALDRLEAEGFITVSPKQGIIVRELSISKVSDIFGLRAALELYVMDQIAGKIKPEHQKKIEQNIRLQEEFISTGDEVSFAKADAAFHLLLCEVSGNEEIYRVMEMYQDHLYRVVLRVLKRDNGRMPSSTKDHAAIYQALCSGDTVASRELMKEHLIYGKRILTL